MADELFSQNTTGDDMGSEAPESTPEAESQPESSEQPKRQRKTRSSGTTRTRVRKRVKAADEGPVASSDDPVASSDASLDSFDGPEASSDSPDASSDSPEASSDSPDASSDSPESSPDSSAIPPAETGTSPPTVEYGTIDLTKIDAGRSRPLQEPGSSSSAKGPAMQPNGQAQGKGRSDRRGDNQGDRRGNRDRSKKDRKRNEGGSHPGEPLEGMLELIGDKKFGFMRAYGSSLTKGDNDPFMPPPLIQKHNLRDGVMVKGVIKPGRKGAWQVTQVDEVMGVSPDEWADLTEFDSGTTIYPEEKLNLITGPDDHTMRVIDLVAPLGKGQRALIVAPPRAGKTVILKQIAEGIATNHKEVKLVALLVDERPEEVTDFKRNTAANVFASSNDFGEDNHVRVATLAFEYSRRLVEMGHDVVILLDSLTRLGRTFNLWGGNSGRTMSGGLDARALVMPRKIFGAARNIENGGSLTIIATSLIETGSRMDDVIFEEFKGTGNSEIVLDRELADKRIYPAINIRKSGTRNEERLMADDVLRQRHMLFRVLAERHPVEAMQALLKQVQRSPTNEHLLNELIPEQTY